MGRKSRMLVFALDAVHRLMQMKGITDDNLREAGIGVRTIQRFHTLCNFRALPSTYMKLCKVLGCKKSDITCWQGYEMPESYYDEQERRPRRCVVCGKMFIPFTTTRRPDGTLSVAGWDYCSFQCCEEDNPEFKRRDNRKGLENFRGHGNNFAKRKSSESTSFRALLPDGSV